ncbi:protein YIPF1 [Sitodiplosis mosellana]|uniref:protein YIPF1 n=1 Tax=Sitodiplosis mosellana TaxID=263140 RepID=UPI0024450A92|nr:protein YIPF1 [Sitodiplosis mosellana]
MNTDDLLSFKEYSPVHESQSQGGIPEININSPNRMRSPYQNATTTVNQSTTSDPLQDLINSMSASVNVLQNDERQRAAPADDINENPRTNHSIFSIEFYQKFFDVDAAIVYERIMSAIIPRRAPVNYMKQDIGSNPDLYGPFWIFVTLVFSIAISGNIASYLQQANTNYHWVYNFHLVSIAATTIIVYVILIPFALWAAFKFTVRPVDSDLISEENGIYTPSFLSLICIYGYSLGIYIPVSVLWLIQISLLQWILVFGAALSTGTVLIIILSPALQNSSKSVFLISGILIVHFLLAAGFMLKFFHTAPSTVTASASANVTS